MIKSNNSANQFLNEVNNKVRLSDFIGQFVNLVERGNSFVGNCPFHNDKTPSFNVNNDKSLFYCFGCKAGGNIVNFISKYKNLQFLESLIYISQYSGIPYVYDQRKSTISWEAKLLTKILNKSNTLFKELLIKKKIAYKYIKERGITDEALKIFNIGFAPDHKDLLKFLELEDFDFDEIKKTDLLIKNKKGEFFGRFSNRITFPIYNFSNDIVGFGARAIQNSKIKYINSQESLVFKKSQLLYGLKQNLEHIRSEKELFLVEGYMDVIKLYCSGIKNAVSTLGTTLSEMQLKKMWNFSDIPFICFDGDDAGQSASKKIAEKVLKFLLPGKSLKFILIPENLDPDSFLQNKTKEDFLLLKKEAKDLSMMIWESIENSINNATPESVALIDNKINDIVKKIDDAKVSKEYFRFLKSQKENFIWNKNKIRKGFTERSSLNRTIENINEKLFLVMIIFYKNYLTDYHEEIFQIKLSNELLENVKAEVLKSYTTESKFFFEEEKNYKKLAPNLLSEIKELKKTHASSLNEEEKKVFFKQILNNLRLPNLLDERTLIEKQMVESSEKVISENLLKKFNKISHEIKNIQNKSLE
tara:strand:+ start:427 stop:2187 length:1761 start_codon:yes stop_codon:yes gene_type:complete